MSWKFALTTLPAAMLLVGLSTGTKASEIYDPSVSSCSGVNCSSVIINGTVTNPASNNHPWVIETYARTGECVRLQTLSQAVDLEMAVTAPNGSLYRNDDGGVAPCSLCSLVKFTAPNTGWYTVQLSQFAGTPSYSDFQLAYGRYSGGNANCATPTAPAVASQAAAAKAGVSASDGLGAGTR